MNLKSKCIKNWTKLLIIVLPCVLIALEVYRTGVIEWANILNSMPTMSFANDIINFLTSVNITLGNFGNFCVSYLVYVVLVELSFIIVDFLLWLPRLFQDVMNKVGD